MSKKAIIIDGNSLIYRTFYATFQQLDYYKKFNLPPANSIKLVGYTLMKLLTSQHYDYALFALDHQKKNFRSEQFADYKAGRKAMPEELVFQLPYISQLVNAIGVKTLSIPSIEADDIVGSYCKLMNENDVEVTVFTSDKDMLQLVNDKSIVSLFKKGISEMDVFSNENFQSKFFGLKPSQIPDFKGIAGDHSDNLSGVKGIGPKSAIDLIIKYGNLENILSHTEELTTSQKQKFDASKEHALLCKSLATIKLDVLNGFKIEDFITNKINKDETRKILNQFKIRNLEELINKL